MTPEEFTDKMRQIARRATIGPGEDEEQMHQQADALICKALKALGYTEGIAIFDEMTRWYA